jgi:protease-4
LASDLIWNEIRKVKESKPVIVSMSGAAASGGYYIACLGDSIFANPGTLTGSIGVYGGKLNRRQMYEKIGMNREFIKRGENALLFSDEGGFTSEQRQMFQTQMDDFYERFLAKVADGRGLDLEAVRSVAQGRVWTGNQGLQQNLVDDLGGLKRALDAAKRMLGLDPSDKVSVVSFRKELSLLERMLLKSLRDEGALGRLGAGLVVPDELRNRVQVAENLPWSQLLQSLRDDGTLAAVALMDGRPIAMPPFWLRIQ